MEKEKKYLLFNWTLLIGCGAIICFAFYSCVYTWPTQGSFIWFLLIIFCPLFLYHTIYIGYVLIWHKRPLWKKTYRFVILVVGILFAGGLLLTAQKISLIRFTNAYGWLVWEVSQQMPSPCRPDYAQISKVSRFNQTVTQKLLVHGQPIGNLFYNKQRFVVYFRAGSVDMDNATLFYDSQSRVWHFFHNEDLKELVSFSSLTKGLAQCPVF